MVGDDHINAGRFAWSAASNEPMPQSTVMMSFAPAFRRFNTGRDEPVSVEHSVGMKYAA
jgi:hypothetical protein